MEGEHRRKGSACRETAHLTVVRLQLALPEASQLQLALPEASQLAAAAVEGGELEARWSTARRETRRVVEEAPCRRVRAHPAAAARALGPLIPPSRLLQDAAAVAVLKCPGDAAAAERLVAAAAAADPGPAAAASADAVALHDVASADAVAAAAASADVVAVAVA